MSEEKSLQPIESPDAALAQLDALGGEFSDVLGDSQEETGKTRPALPMVKVDHSKTGKHSFYLQEGDEITLEGQKSFAGHIVAQNYMGEFYTEDGELIWLEIDGEIRVAPDDAKDPITFQQLYGRPKGKVRLFVVALDDNGEPRRFKMKIPGSSIRGWQDAVRSLQRAKLPMIISKCIFTLEDVKDGDYRYAKIVPTFTKTLATKPILEEARRWKADLEHYKREADPVDAPVADNDSDPLGLNTPSEQANAPKPLSDDDDLPFS